MKERPTDIYRRRAACADIINMVLDIQQARRSGFGIALTIRPFNAWLSDLIGHFRQRFAEKQCRTRIRSDDAVGIPFDEAKLRVVVSNLLANACEIPSGRNAGIRLHGTLQQWCGSVFRIGASG